ncbi:LTA synthase family protein [Arenibacter latericius]|uniref:LTA synthase family protein n=1 Tax=Arenibacter latericius TaxID=86104 RepID=UPI0004202DF9|nr:LTA synthase family protein [Arenibacter latericius]MDX1363301.1 LTA synthase family protein [Arenibacter latericius]
MTLSTLKSSLFKALQSFSIYALIALIFLWVISAIELFIYKESHFLPMGYFSLLKSSLFIDTVFWVQWVFIPFIIFTLIFILHQKTAKIFLGSILVLLFIIHLSLINYYNTSLVLLGADLFGYSIKDIKQTVGASGGVSLISVLGVFIVLALLLLALYFIPKKWKAPKAIAIALPIASLLVYSTGIAKVIAKPQLSTDFANNLVVNKSEHFYSEAANYLFKKGYEVDIYADDYLGGPGAAQLAGLKTVDYIDDAYPFLHTRPQDDVLSPFFKAKQQAPNIVVIIVEGLGRAYTNEDAYLGNFTPYLDSLSQNSLYWKNFLSNGGRTFAVLPSLVGSLPFAENGFLALEDKMPNENSLMSILKNHGYEASFYYGGDASFDGMKGYLEKNGIDNIFDEGTFPSTYKKLPANNNFTWGYGDNELYRYYLNSQRDDTITKPKLNILLTVTTHSPFLLHNNEYYKKRFEERLDELGFNNDKKKEYEGYAKQYATILYADDAIKDFIKEYKKRDDYENTIFLITGDHRIPEIPMSTKIDRYHVPLLLFSPMLTRTAEIASLSSHFDIAPSLLNYLGNNHQVQLPEQVSFMGSGLDTVRKFRNIKQIPLMQTKTDLVDFVMGDYHLNGNNLYQLIDNMGEVLVDNPEKKRELQAAFEAFKRRNRELINEAPLVPDSIYKKYNANY